MDSVGQCCAAVVAGVCKVRWVCCVLSRVAHRKTTMRYICSQAARCRAVQPAYARPDSGYLYSGGFCWQGQNTENFLGMCAKSPLNHPQSSHAITPITHSNIHSIYSSITPPIIPFQQANNNFTTTLIRRHPNHAWWWGHRVPRTIPANM